MTEKYTGFHSTIKEVHLDGPPRDFLEKRYGEKAQGFEMSTAFSIARDMKRFGTIASEIGIPVVSAIGHVIYNNGHEGRVDMAEYVPRIGPNLLQVMESQIRSGEEGIAMDSFKKYLGMFKAVSDAGYPISLDPPLTNFCVDHENKLWYVDSMPPRQKREDGSYLSELPLPSPDMEGLLIERYFSLPGQTQVIYAQAVRNLLPLGVATDTIKGAITEVLGEEARNAIDLEPEKMQQMMDEPGQSDVDKIRFIAAEQYEKCGLSGDVLKEVYRLCHIGIGGKFPSSETLLQAVHLLSVPVTYEGVARM